MTEDQMFGRHHRLNGHKFKQALGDGKGQGGLACCSPWGHKVGHNWVTKQQQQGIIMPESSIPDIHILVHETCSYYSHAERIMMEGCSSAEFKMRSLSWIIQVDPT